MRISRSASTNSIIRCFPLVTTQCSLYVPSSWTLNNSTFCPHSVFMCFVWISEQTAIISLYNINWLVCTTETQCVYCAVRTEPVGPKYNSRYFYSWRVWWNKLFYLYAGAVTRAILMPAVSNMQHSITTKLAQRSHLCSSTLGAST